MHPRGPSTRGRVGLIIFAAALVALGGVLPLSSANADVAFRKKKAAPASTDSGALEGSPSGGDTAATAATEGGEGAPAGEGGEKPAATGPTVPQAEDRDKPRDPSLVEKTPAEVELERKMAAKKAEPALYTKWQFWAIVGGAAVGAAVAIWGGLKLAHEVNGGDVRGCNPTYSTCFGEGH